MGFELTEKMEDGVAEERLVVRHDDDAGVGDQKRAGRADCVPSIQNGQYTPAATP